MDLNAVPAIHRLSHLPVPWLGSATTGKWYLVTLMAKAAAAVGADGLIIDVHPNSDEARSNGAQTLTFENFGKLMTQVGVIRDTATR